MKQKDFIAADEGVIAVDAVHFVDTKHLVEEGYIEVLHDKGQNRITGFFAIEALMMLKPSALEGKRLRWHRRAWLVHNVVAHPLMQFMALAADATQPISALLAQRLRRAAMRVHDATVPVPAGFRNADAQPKPD